MRDIRIATAQFETKDGDKAYNLARIANLAKKAADEGAEMVCFHEMCICAYSWLQPLGRKALAELAEEVPGGPSTEELTAIAHRCQVVISAGLLEIDSHGRFYNAYVTVSPSGYVTHFRKIHPFINQHLSAGDDYCVVDLLGCKVGFLVCYDNNLIENVRATALMGAEIIVMPHVTGCLPSQMPGRGVVDRQLWDNRWRDPVPLRQEFDGPKGRGWLMRWLPSRAYENGVYAVFTNNIGWDYDTVKPGLSMILDPFGEVITECRALGDEVTVGLLTSEKLGLSSGQRYLKARRPELYGRLVEPQESVTAPGWDLKHACVED